MFPGASLAVVFISNYDPLYTFSLVLLGHLWHASIRPSQLVLDVVHVVVLGVDAGDQEIVGDVLEMSAELEPRSSGGDVISGALSLHFDQNLQKKGDIFSCLF